MRRYCLVSLLLLGIGMSANAGQMLISVSLDTTAREESALDGPVDGVGGSDLGTTWNQILAGPGFGVDVSRTDLVDSTGAATTVDFSVDGGVGMWAWGTPDLVVLTSGILGWDPDVNPYDLVFSGLGRALWRFDILGVGFLVLASTVSLGSLGRR